MVKCSLSRLVPVLLVCAGLAPAFAAELVLLNWDDYLDPEVVAEFEQRTGARVQQVYFESDDMRDELMVQSDGRGYDLVMVSGAAIDGYVRRGWLAPVDEGQVPNLRLVDRRWRDAYPGADGYGVPYFWGTLGIAYRKDLTGRELKGWMDVLRPDPAWKGRIMMIKTARDTLGVALKALGHSVNSTDPDEIKEAGELLLGQRPYVSAYSYVSFGEGAELKTGAIYVALVYSGDGLQLKGLHPAIEYVTPAEGTQLWVDYLSVVGSSAQKGLAYRFLDFLNEPEVAARQARFVHYATPNAAAERLLPAEFRADPVIYPPPEVLARSETYAALPPRALKLRNELFARLLR
jgi:spermidine/putrescine transport system substrate-binding protein